MPAVVVALAVWSAVVGRQPTSENEIAFGSISIPLLTVLFGALVCVDILENARRGAACARYWGLRRHVMIPWSILCFLQIGWSLAFGFTRLGISYLLALVLLLTWWNSTLRLPQSWPVISSSLRSWAMVPLVVLPLGWVTGHGLRVVPDNINLTAMLLTLSGAAALVGVRRGMLSRIWAIAPLLILLQFALDGRRTAVFSLTAVFLVLLVQTGSSIRKLRGPLVAAAFAAALGATLVPAARAEVASSFGYISSALEVFDSDERERTDDRRAEIVSLGWDVALDESPVGVGHGRYLEAAGARAASFQVVRPHNFLILSFAELGLVGLAVGVWCVLSPLRLALRATGIALRRDVFAVALVPIPFLLTNDYLLSPGYWCPLLLAGTIASAGGGRHGSSRRQEGLVAT